MTRLIEALCTPVFAIGIGSLAAVALATAVLLFASTDYPNPMSPELVEMAQQRAADTASISD